MKKEAAGLAAHLHNILQLHQDLTWQKYDVEFRQWAAAKGVHVWGKLNMAIYGRCLPQPQEGGGEQTVLCLVQTTNHDQSDGTTVFA